MSEFAHALDGTVTVLEAFRPYLRGLEVIDGYN